jgi:hypothetical protein
MFLPEPPCPSSDDIRPDRGASFAAARTFVKEQASMKGVTILRDEKSHKRYVQIDVDLIEKDREAVEDYLDAILIEARRKEASVPLADFERRLKKSKAK